MCHARSSGTNHVHMSLQYDDIGFLISFRTGFFHDHIALFVGNSIKIMVNCELDKVFRHSLCIARTARNSRNLLKVAKYIFGL